MNRRLSDSIVDSLAALGVRDWCACAGARNSPLFTTLLERGDLRTLRFFEERSAAFFALGRIKATGRPVAVLTTSGTAAAELLPAIIEAHYSGLPLVAVTADRPRRYRGTGAPQSIEQVGLFGKYAAISIDLAPGEKLPEIVAGVSDVWHLNVCFEEPLLGDPPGEKSAPAFRWREPQPDDGRAAAALRRFLRASRRPLVVIGPLAESEQAATAAFVERLGAPVIAEAPSGLRGRLGERELLCGERLPLSFWRDEDERAADGVLRLGGVPTGRLWRDLDSSLTKVPVLSLSALPFSGLTRGERAAWRAGIDARARWDEAILAAWRDRDRDRYRRLQAVLDAYPRSEPAMVRAFSRLLPEGAPLYLGNSLPVREWDLAAVPGRGPGLIGVNRGANGIDGQLSTFFGFARPGRVNWALLGDLTTLYDLSAPWVLPQLGSLRFVLGVMHNGGGAIFSRMFARPEFQNRHAVGFAPWAAMWGLAHETWDTVPGAWEPGPSLVAELRPDESATAAFWREYDALWS